MKKVFIFLFAGLSIFSSCKKETENNSFITHYVDLQIKGDEIISQKVGTAFTDPGFTAIESGKDVSSNVKIDGQVDVNTCGTYYLTYKIANADGYEAKVTRTVCVNNPQTLEGAFVITSSRKSSSSFPGNYITIKKTDEEGVYSVSCLIGGWYSQGRNYGKEFECPGHIKVAEDGTISLIDGYLAYWDAEVTSLEGKFDKTAGTFSWTAVWNGFTFVIENM
ncbi:MAG: DUF5012 domain-containing protein [Bacteroidales bacterium]|nr:DUF5012 domain-containing protein [Bacteroidales bacterium]